MPSPNVPSAREALIQSLGRLSDEEKEKLHGPGWAMYATQKARSLQNEYRWVLALTVTMGLLALALPTSAFYHYYDTTDSFTILEFLGLIGAACTFAAVQMGGAVYVYMNWHHQLRCYQALRALGREDKPAASTGPSPST